MPDDATHGAPGDSAPRKASYGDFEDVDDFDKDEEDDDAIDIEPWCFKSERTVVQPDGTLSTEYLWPERYAPAWYERKRRTLGIWVYGGEMLGEPEREGDLFRREWFPLYETLPPCRVWYSWFDPAFGKSRHACYKAIVVVAWDGLTYHVVDAWLRQTDPIPHALLWWQTAFQRYGPLGLVHGGYENDFGQHDRLARDFADMSTPLRVSPDTNRHGSKEARIESLVPLASVGRIAFPARMTPDVETLYNQLLAYPSGYTDGPDALESCISRLRGGSQGPVEYTSLAPRRYAPRPTRRHR